MQDIAIIEIKNFIVFYVILLVIGFLIRYSNVDIFSELLISSLRMCVQLVLAGLVLIYILNNPRPIFVIAYVTAMIVFSGFRILNKCSGLNKKFKIYTISAVVLVNILVLSFFITVLINKSIFNPRYSIPIAGMLVGNSMTAQVLGINTFLNTTKAQKSKIVSLINVGVNPKEILKPMVSDAIKTAIVPTFNSMAGMGIVFLPGMMTGQILSGTIPSTAVLYQLAIMIAITTSSLVTTYLALTFGYKTMIDENQNIVTAG